ncbi:MAG: TonB-dependent siderophore receptor [Burkholderiaceae bacterium]
MPRVPLCRPAPLAVAVGLAVAVAAAHAQGSAAGTSGAPTSFNLVAQPLSQALGNWALQTGVQLIVQPALVAGKTAPAVSGTLTPQQALDRLLAGSGLTAVPEGNAVVIKAAPASAGSTSLPEVVVRGAPELDATTEGGGYAARAATMFGSARSLKDIPSSVSVLTRQQMDDQNIKTITEAMQYATGVSPVSYFGNGGASSTAYFNARGFPVNVALDGLSIVNGIQYQPQFDMAMYDRVEVFRGPSGLLSGQGDLGGSVNLVRKKPTEKFQLKSETSIGSWANYRQMIDVSGPLNKEGTLRGRVVGVAAKANSFLDGQHSREGMGYGVLEYDIDPQTTVSLSAGYQKAPAHRPDYGVGYDSAGNLITGPRRWSQNFAPDWNYASNTFKEANASVKHRFDNGWNAEATVMSRKFQTYNKYAFALTPVAGLNTADYAGQRQNLEYDWLGADAHISGPVTLWGRRHDVLVGVNHTSYHYQGSYGSQDLGSYDIFSPLIPEPDMPYSSGGKTRTDLSSLYGHVHSRLTDNLSLVLGGKEVFYRQQTKTTLPIEGDWSSDAKMNGKFVPYGGLIYALTPQVSAYASYTKIFSPQTGASYSGAAIQPFTGEQYEIGLKSGFLDDRLHATIAAFRINGNHLAVSDQLHPGYSVDSGAMRSEGWEAEVSGSLLPNWDLVAGYTLTNTRYTSSPTAQGQSYDGETPKHLLKLWNSYRFTQHALQGLTVGGGVYFQSATWRFKPQYRQGAYAIYSAKIGYRFSKNLEADLTVNNLFDKRYYSRAPYTLFAEYGAPRAAVLTLRTTF